jgi:hypothetical protein
MALIEIEFRTGLFNQLATLIGSRAPIPVPTFDAIGGDRLITNIAWTSVSVGEVPSGYVVPPGTLTARAAVVVTHISIAELESNPAATPTTSNTDLWLLISVTAGALAMVIVRVDVAGNSSTPAVPITVGSQKIPLPAGAASPVLSAILLRDDIVTLRFATSGGDDVLAPPSNRLTDGDWLVRVSGELFAEQIVDRLTQAVSPPPGGAVIEDAPVGGWVNIFNTWAAVASVGLLKEDACPGLFGSVNISDTVSVVMTLNPNKDATPTPQLGLNLTVSSDVSDWDSLRCWLGSGGIAGLFVAVFNAYAGLVVGLASLLGIAEYIKLSAGAEVTSTPLGTDFHEVSHTDTSKTYEATMDLPMVSGTVIDTAVGGDGLIVWGQRSLIPSATHAVTFQPGGPALPGSWHGTYSCRSSKYLQEYLIAGVEVTDLTQAYQLPDIRVPVTVFSTSTVIPAASWSLTHLAPAFDQYVEVHVRKAPGTGSGKAKSHPTTGRAYIHTSAGLRRYILGPIPAAPSLPDAIQMEAMRLNCSGFSRWFTPQEKLHWQEEQPTIDYGIDPLRQWQLTISELPEGASINLHTAQTLEGGQTPLVSLRASRPGAAVIEVLTDAGTEVVLEHNLKEAPAGSRMSQRWLLPRTTLELPEQPRSMKRTGSRLEILTDNHRVLVSTDDWSTQTVRRDVSEELPAPQVLSITLPDTRVVAVHGNRLVVAAPFGI